MRLYACNITFLWNTYIYVYGIGWAPQRASYKIAVLSIQWENGADICPDELYNNSN